MRAGIVCRAEDGGLGHLTWDASRNLEWDRVAVIHYRPLPGTNALHLDRFPGATLLDCDMARGRVMVEGQCREWLRGLDVVYLAETAYDWRFIRWAESEGVATVIHGMPEYTPHARGDDLPSPTRWWWPTPWRLPYLPAGDLVPVPIPSGTRDALACAADPYDDGPLRVHHIVGRRCAHDRNGTSELLRAVRHLEPDVEVSMFTQEDRLPSPLDVPAGVKVVQNVGGVAGRTSLFMGAHVLVMPRRYGGLCLPVQEGMGCGVPSIMPDINPQWPVVGFPVSVGEQVQFLGGTIQFAKIDPREIAATINRLNRDRDELVEAQRAAREWAEWNTWERLAPVWRERLTYAANLTTVD